MSSDTLIPLLVIITFAAYFQTVTGFGLAMIVMGAASGFNLASMPVMAVVVSLIMMVNSAVALKGRLHLIDWRAARAALAGVLPSVIAGVILLEYLSTTAVLLLKFLLGATITYGGVMCVLLPTPLPRRSSDLSFFISGILAGLLSGLFGMAGPPVIFHFYRQPMDLIVVRSMLLLIFLFNSAVRIVFVASQGGITGDVWLLASFSVLLVALATYAGRRHPPPLSPVAMRRIAFSVLILIGLGLMTSALLQGLAAA